MMIQHLDRIGHRLYCRSTSTMDGEPTALFHWYLIWNQSPEGWTDCIGATLRGHGVMYLEPGPIRGTDRSIEPWGCATSAEFRTDPTQKPTFFARRPFPCPKVRANIETHWYQGRWEKLLKSRGWVDLPTIGIVDIIPFDLESPPDES